jgi:DNA replication protein DnaD
VSFDAKLFCKELEKAMRTLLPYEIDQLREWLLQFTVEKPELRQCLIYIN